MLWTTEKGDKNIHSTLNSEPEIGGHTRSSNKENMLSSDGSYLNEYSFISSQIKKTVPFV